MPADQLIAGQQVQPSAESVCGDWKGEHAKEGKGTWKRGHGCAALKLSDSARPGTKASVFSFVGGNIVNSSFEAQMSTEGHRFSRLLDENTVSSIRFGQVTATPMKESAPKESGPKVNFSSVVAVPTASVSANVGTESVLAAASGIADDQGAIEIFRVMEEQKTEDELSAAAAARAAVNNPDAVLDELVARIARHGARLSDLFRSWDSDGDGLMSKRELKMALEVFARSCSCG